MAVWGWMCGLIMTCLWPGFSLDLDSLRTGYGAVICPGGGMFGWTALWASLMP